MLQNRQAEALEPFVKEAPEPGLAKTKACMRYTALSFLAAALLTVGCGSSVDNSVAGSQLPVAGVSNTTLTGRFFLGSDVGGAQVTLLDSTGSVLSSGMTTRSDGTFFFRGTLPDDLTVRIRAADSQVDFYADLHRENYVVVNVPTTLVHLLRQASGASLPEARLQIAARLALPATYHSEWLAGDSSRSPFSHLAFFQAADEAGGLTPFAQSLVSGNPAARAFRLTPSVLRRPYTHFDSGLLVWLERARLGITVLPSETDESLLKNAFGFIFDGIKSSIRDPLINTVWTWIGSQLGFNFGTTQKLNTIINDLNTILQDLADIKTQLNNSEFLNQLTSLETSSVSPLRTLNSEFDGFQGGLGTPDVPRTPTVQITRLLSDISQSNTVENAVANIREAMSGPPATNLMLKYQTFLLNQKLGVDQPGRFGAQPLRSYTINGKLANFKAYYGNWQALGASLLSESVHASPTLSVTTPSPNMANGIQLVNRYARSLAVSVGLQQQQFTGQLPPEDIVIDLEHGLMWYSKVYSPATFDDALETAANLKVALDNSSVVYDDWRLPTYSEGQSLQARGRYSAEKDSTVATNSNGAYPDTGSSVAGLTALGFQHLSSSDGGPNTNGSIWMKPYVGISLDFPGSWDYFKYFEFKLNRLNDDNEYKSATDKVNFFCVRSIGSPLLPFEDFAPNLSGKQTGTEPASTSQSGKPSGLDFNPVGDEEYPMLGVATAVDLQPTEGTTQLNPSITYKIFLGGNFTYGTGDQTEQSSCAAATLGPVVLTNRPDLAVYQAATDGQTNPPLDIGNLAGSNGLVTWHGTTGTPIPAVATNATVTGYNGTSFSPIVSPSRELSNSNPVTPHIRVIQIMPRSQINNQGRSNAIFQCAAFYDDGTVRDVTSQVSWSLAVDPNVPSSSLPSNVHINSAPELSPGLLQFQGTNPVGTPGVVEFLIRASLVDPTNQNQLNDSTGYQTATN